MPLNESGNRVDILLKLWPYLRIIKALANLMQGEVVDQLQVDATNLNGASRQGSLGSRRDSVRTL